MVAPAGATVYADVQNTLGQATPTTEHGHASKLTWAVSQMQGWRVAMEDAHVVKLQLGHPLASWALFGVFDGHGGAAVSARVASDLPGELVKAASILLDSIQDEIKLVSQAIRRALLALDNSLRLEGHGQRGILPGIAESEVKNLYSFMGSTAIVALVRCDGSPKWCAPRQVVVANLGDSRGLISRAGHAMVLSHDHKPHVDAERQRIERAGGYVSQVGLDLRIDGWGLNITRALGDFHYKNREDLPTELQKVSSHADITTFDLSADDEFMVLGSDGIFELHSNQGIIDHVRSALQDGKRVPHVVECLVRASISANLEQTGGKGGDNVTAAVVLFKPHV